MIAKADAEQYIRMTLKQWSVDGLPVAFHRQLGWSNPSLGEYRFFSWLSFSPKEILLAPDILYSFNLFRHVFLHELAHLLDHRERGTLIKNGRRNGHGASFNRWCKKLNIQKGAYVPEELIPSPVEIIQVRQKFS